MQKGDLSLSCQYLAKDSKLLQSLGQRWLCSKSKIFQKEACQIFSNLAVRSKFFRKNTDTDRLIDPLRRLLEEDDFDVKMEAAFSLFFISCGGKYVEWQNQNQNLESLGAEHFSIGKAASFPIQRPAQNINYSIFQDQLEQKQNLTYFSATSQNFNLL